MPRKSVIAAVLILITASGLIFFIKRFKHNSDTQISDPIPNHIPIPSVDPLTFDGTWKSTGDVIMSAQIKDNTIDIDWIVDENSKGIYWLGTFPTPKTMDKNAVIISYPNQEVMELSVLGSTAKSKEFLYVDGKISFDFQALGMSTRVELEKQ
jgi:hypothetical protein